jgi:hypothetical protein
MERGGLSPRITVVCCLVISVRRALTKDPERRYQTAKDLRNDLETLRDDLRVPAPITTVSMRVT